MYTEVQIYTDGGSRGNPGPAGAGYVLKNTNGSEILAKGVYLNENTNNFAEYSGVIEALKSAAEIGAEKIKLFSDSQLMVRQINGEYKVKSPNLKPLYQEAISLLGRFKSWEVIHVYRENNKRADEMANKAMDMKSDVCEKSSTTQSVSKRLRLGVMLSGGGTTMVNIQNEIAAGNLNAEIVVVISSRSDVKGIERARKLGLEPLIIKKKDFSGIGDFSCAIAKALIENEVELVIQAGWLCLWQIPAEFENKVMNIHPSLLPSFGGKGMWGHHVHEAVLKNGCKVSGCTVHFCTNEYDKGPIIVQRCCAAYDKDSPDELAARVFEEECKAYPEAIKLFCEGKIRINDNIVEIIQEN